MIIALRTKYPTYATVERRLETGNISVIVKLLFSNVIYYSIILDVALKYVCHLDYCGINVKTK